MKISAAILLLLSLFTQCSKEGTPVSGRLNQKLDITLHQTIALTGPRGDNIPPDNVQITFTDLNDSRCPMNVMCIRNGSAVTHFRLERNSRKSGPVELVISDALPTDTRKLRHRAADTTLVTVDNARYQIILSNVIPYPCAGCPDQETPKASIEVNAQ